MSLTKKVAFNTVFQVVAKVVATALSLASIGYLTRYLGVAGYGDYTTIFAFVSFWAVIADFGFFWVLVRELAKPGADKSRIFDNIITLKIVFGFVVFSVCIAVGLLIPQYSWTIKTGIALISASWFWMSLNGTYVGLFQSQFVMYKASISEVVGRVIILSGIIWAVVAGANFQVILLTYIFGNLINLLINHIWGRRFIKFHFCVDWPYWKLILIDSAPLALLSTIGLVHFKIDTVILSLIKGPIDVGIYGIPYKILEIIIFLPAIFIGNIFPILTRYFHTKDNRLKVAIQKTFDFLIILAVPISIGLIVLATPIVRLIGGEAYILTSTISVYGHIIAAPQVVMILGFAIIATFLPMIFSSLLTVLNKQSKQIWPMIIITTTNIVLNLIFIPKYSYFAAAIVTCVTEFMILIWWYYLSRKYLNYQLSYGVIPKVITAAAVMGVILHLLKDRNTFVVILLGVVIYFTVGYLLKLFNRQTIKDMLPSVSGGDKK